MSKSAGNPVLSILKLRADIRWSQCNGMELIKHDSLEAGKAACELDYRERLRGIFKAKE